MEKLSAQQTALNGGAPLSPAASPSASKPQGSSLLPTTAPAEAPAQGKGKATAALAPNSILGAGAGAGGVSVSGGHVVLCVSGSADFGPGAANDQSDSPETKVCAVPCCAVLCCDGMGWDVMACDGVVCVVLKAARAYFESLSARAQRTGSTVHAFGVGEASFAVRDTLRPLTAGCGGGVYLHAAFTDQTMLKDMLHALFRGTPTAFCALVWFGVVLWMRCDVMW